MSQEFSKLGLEPHVDVMGNVAVRVREAKPGSPRVLVFAHMDEVGFVVRKIEPDGFLRLHRLGGIPEKSLAGQRVVFLGRHGLVPGVIGTKSHHVTPADEKYRVVPLEDLYVDVGAATIREAQEMGLHVGTLGVYAPSFQRRGWLVQGKAMDNRVGCAVLVELARILVGGQDGAGSAGVYLVGSVQEEFNLRGVLPIVRELRPDIAISVDIAVACDTPDLRQVTDVSLNRGPTINLYSFHGRGTLNGVLPNRKLAYALMDAAEAAAVPSQFGSFFGGLTEAAYVQLEGGGIPSIEVGVPCRYTHSPVEVCSLQDINHTARMLAAFVRQLSSGIDLSRG
ncbi:MAG: M42 family peptidase [Limnochordaceae bacterium]|nr:M42 family peptidase [Limnochordaceae bacterium]